MFKIMSCAAGIACAIISVCGSLALCNRCNAEEAVGEVPLVVLDESSSRWVVDRFAGNSGAGPKFIQGPARQTGGLGSPCIDVAPDGSVFMCADAENKWALSKIVRVSPDGTLRLLAGGGSSLADGPASKALIRVESLRYCTADKSVYFTHRTIPCVRRLYEKDGQWFVETVAGSTEKTGTSDGAGKEALFTQPRSLAITSTGVIYVLDGTSLLRKIEKGQVSTVAKFGGGKQIVDGPLAKANFSITAMSGEIVLGENDDTLYVADHWNFAARKIDLKAGLVSTVAGMPVPAYKPKDQATAFDKRYNSSADGPALTHASFNSGCAFVCWDNKQKALWMGGPDELRLRWAKDGWVKTVLPFKSSNKWRTNGLGLKPDEVWIPWCHVKAVDAQGMAYISTASAQGVWRAYEKGDK